MDAKANGAGVHKPCAFNPDGATEAFCRRTSGKLENATGACLAKGCQSPWRLCVACVRQNAQPPSLKLAQHDRLCGFHANNSERAVRPVTGEELGAGVPVSERKLTTPPSVAVSLPVQGSANKKDTSQMQSANQDSLKIDREALALQVPALSTQQRTILRLICEGKDNAEICRRTGLRELFTPGNPLGEIYKSFGLRHMRSARQKRQILREVYDIYSRSSDFVDEGEVESVSQTKRDRAPAVEVKKASSAKPRVAETSPVALFESEDALCVTVRLVAPEGVEDVKVTERSEDLGRFQKEGFRVEFVLVGPGTSIRHILVKRT